MDDSDVGLNKRGAQERLLISKLSREDLENKYLDAYENNIVLKKLALKQEDRIKKMATKLIRLVNDKKKSGGPNSFTIQTNSGKKVRDVEVEECISELQAKISELELQNKRLRDNLQLNKIQMQTLQTQKNPVGVAYSNVTARIDTGLPRREPSTHRTVRANSGNMSARSAVTPVYSNYSTARQAYNPYQDEEVERLRIQIEDYESEIRNLRDQLHQQNLHHEDALHRVKNQVSQSQLIGVQENIDQIRLQRELKEKANQFSELFAKFNNISQQHAVLKDNHDHLLEEIERYNQMLKQEQQRSVSLRTELKNASQHSREVLELKERNDDLTREVDALKDANQKLLTSAFSLEREREFRERERALKIQIAQLEATLKSDVGEKGTILDRLTNEREQYDKLNNEAREMQVKYYEMKQKYDEMNEKMLFLSKESNIDFREIEEALIIVKERKSIKELSGDEFFNKVDSEKIKIYQRKLVDLEAHLAETTGELDKSRLLLITQVKINDDYKKEVFLIQSKMEENKAEYDAKILEYAQLLDIRAARIKKLERQLKDIAYGTRQVRIDYDPDTLGPLAATTAAGVKPSELGKRRSSYSFVGAPTDQMLDHQLIANLERGQNIFEIHLTRMVLTEVGLRLLGEQDPSTFCTVEFFEHELQTTPIVKGAKPEYNFTSQYIIKVDDFFLHYLQKETTTIELHQAIGSDYETQAACQLSFRELIDKQTPRIHGTARLIGVKSGNAGETIGAIEYWARLIVPVDEAFRLYKERSKALGYISTNVKAAQQAESKLEAAAVTHENKQRGGKAKSIDNMNELNVTVRRCSKLNSHSKKMQPSAYCVYKFYDFNDHDTEIIPSSNYPEFNDHKSFAVPMDIDLDKYLKKESLSLYVFDDNEPEDSGLYLGVSTVPLIGLAHDKDIQGTFELIKPDGSSNGTVEISLYWQYSYLPPAASTFAASGSKQPSNAKSSASLLPHESAPESLAQKAKKMGVKVTSQQVQQQQKFLNQLPAQDGAVQHVRIERETVVMETVETHSHHQPKRESPVAKTSESRRSSVRNSPPVPEDNIDPGGTATFQNGQLVGKPKRSSVSSIPDEKPASKLGKLPDIKTRRGSGNGNGKQPQPAPRDPSPGTGPDRSNGTHYNDTYFGDEARTYSPNELDSLRSQYQKTIQSDEENEDERRERELVRRQTEQQLAAEDNYAEEEPPTSVGDENIGTELGSGSNENTNMNTGHFESTTKSDTGLIVGSNFDPNNTNKLPKHGNEDHVIIEIASLTLNKESDIFKRDDVQALFVAMNFLNYDPADLEAPQSMPKPEPNQVVNFNFRRIFEIDHDNNLEKREELAKVITSDQNPFIKFAVVSEPSDNQDCEDIGYAQVDIIKDILEKNANLNDEKLNIFDANDSKKLIGRMSVTVEILDALRAIREELQSSTLRATQ